MYGEEICKKRAQIRYQKRVRVSNNSFSNTFRAGGKNCDWEKNKQANEKEKKYRYRNHRLDTIY